MSEGSKTDTAAARFAGNIKMRRETLGLSQNDLANQLRNLGLTSFRQQTVAEIESGKRNVRLEEALAFGRILGQTVDSLIRPAGLARKADAILDATNAVLEARRHAEHWAVEHAAQVRRLEKAIAAAEPDAEALADELAIARRALGKAGSRAR